MSGVGMDHLSGLYCDTHDPWGFEVSAREQAKFAATCAALSRPRYKRVFELGCGNGELGGHLTRRCDAYVGFDAVETALDAARRKLPGATFVKGFYPCALPEGDFDLIVLSEILYFLDGDTLRRLADEVKTNWPRAEITCVSYLGDTGHELQGEMALNIFLSALTSHRAACLDRKSTYRIDRALPEART